LKSQAFSFLQDVLIIILIYLSISSAAFLCTSRSD